MPITSAPISSTVVYQHPIATPNNGPIEEAGQESPDVVIEIPLRRLERAYRPVILYDYIIYLQEHVYDVGDVSDPTAYKEAIASPQSNFCIDVMKDEMTCMS